MRTNLLLHCLEQAPVIARDLIKLVNTADPLCQCQSQCQTEIVHTLFDRSVETTTGGVSSIIGVGAPGQPILAPQLRALNLPSAGL